MSTSKVATAYRRGFLTGATGSKARLKSITAPTQADIWRKTGETLAKAMTRAHTNPR